MHNKKLRRSRRIRVRSALPCPSKTFTPLPDSEFECFPRLTDSDYTAVDEAIEWLESRWRISPEVISRYDLRLYMNEATQENGIAFVIRSPSGFPVAMHRMMLDESIELKPIRFRGRSAGESPIVPFWFGQDIEASNPSLVLTSHPLDMLRLATLGIRGAISSCGIPTKAQLDSLSARTVYTAFGARGADYACMPISLMALTRMKRFSLDWEDGGIACARELTSLSQFKKVFLKKRKWISCS